MSDAISRVRAHFDALAPKVIIVPEWDGLQIHTTPVTIAERGRIYGKADANDHELICRILIVKAKDANGQPLFTQADLPALMHHSSPEVVVRVAGEIMASGSPDATELGKS